MSSHKLPVIPNYITVGILGSGHFSNVYKVFTKNYKLETFAAKVFKNTQSPKNQFKIKREVDILIKLTEKLTHRNIVKFVDYIEDDKICSIMLEYCDGGTLRSLLIQRKKLDESLTRFLTQQFVCGLNYLNSLSICHMDLKPENLLLMQGPPYCLKIADFGLSRDLSIANTVCKRSGTITYMAPEKVLRREIGLISDLWSFGLIIRECVTGKQLFAYDTHYQIEKKIKENFPIRDPTCTPPLSDDCKDLMRLLLEYDPNTRLTLEGVNIHPFVDMKHQICPDSYKKAKELIKNAILLDKRYEHDKSLPFYKEALVFIRAFVSVENNNYKKAILNMKICEYCSWIETLEKNPGKKHDIILQPLPDITGVMYEMTESHSGMFTP